MPVHVPLASAMFNVASFSKSIGRPPTVNGSRVSEMAVVVPPIVNRSATSTTAASAVLTLPAHTDAVSPRITGTAIVNGDPPIPADVTVTLALPDAVIVPAAVAVSTCAVPATHAVAVQTPVSCAIVSVDADPAITARSE